MLRISNSKINSAAIWDSFYFEHFTIGGVLWLINSMLFLFYQCVVSQLLWSICPSEIVASKSDSLDDSPSSADRFPLRESISSLSFIQSYPKKGGLFLRDCWDGNISILFHVILKFVLVFGHFLMTWALHCFVSSSYQFFGQRCCGAVILFHLFYLKFWSCCNSLLTIVMRQLYFFLPTHLKF